MTINVSHLMRVSNARYNGLVRRFTGEKGLQESLDYENFIFNALLRYAETGDATHLNNCVAAARTMGRVRLTTRLLKGYSAHEWNGKAFDGKAERKGKLRHLRRMSESEIAMDVAAKLEDEANDSKKQEKVFDLEAFAEMVAKRIIKNEANVIDFERRLERKLAELRAAA